MNELEAINELYKVRNEKDILWKHFVQEKFLDWSQDIFPQNPVFYPIGETEPIWVLVTKISNSAVFFHYASVANKDGTVKPGPMGERKALDIAVGTNPGNISKAAYNRIRQAYALSYGKNCFFQVITKIEQKKHTWIDAFWVTERAIELAFEQHRQKGAK